MRGPRPLSPTAHRTLSPPPRSTHPEKASARPEGTRRQEVSPLALSLRPHPQEFRLGAPRNAWFSCRIRERQRGTYPTPPGCKARERLPQNHCLEGEEKKQNKTKMELQPFSADRLGISYRAGLREKRGFSPRGQNPRTRGHAGSGPPHPRGRRNGQR